jgi:hypothetical protein
MAIRVLGPYELVRDDGQLVDVGAIFRRRCWSRWRWRKAVWCQPTRTQLESALPDGVRDCAPSCAPKNHFPGRRGWRPYLNTCPGVVLSGRGHGLRC